MRRAAERLQMADAVLQVVALLLDQAAGDVEQRLTALVDVGDEQLGPPDVLLDVPLLVRVHAGAAAVQVRRQARVHRVDPQHEAATLDDLDLEARPRPW